MSGVVARVNHSVAAAPAIKAKPEPTAFYTVSKQAWDALSARATRAERALAARDTAERHLVTEFTYAAAQLGEDIRKRFPHGYAYGRLAEQRAQFRIAAVTALAAGQITPEVFAAISDSLGMDRPPTIVASQR